MNIDDLKEYCLEKKDVSFDFPFDDETLVFRVARKIFVLTYINRVPLRMNLKQDPELIPLLKDQYQSVLPGFHMNKKHWISVVCGGDIDSESIKRLIDESYNRVVELLPLYIRKKLGEKYSA